MSTRAAVAGSTNQPLSLTSKALPDGLAGGRYLATSEATGGTTPYAWSAKGLPAGLDIDPATGVVSGFPDSTGSSTVSLTVSDAEKTTRTATLSIAVPAALPADCAAQSCSHTEADARTREVPAADLVSITRDPDTGAVTSIVLSGPTAAAVVADDVLVLPVTADLPTGLTAVATAVSGNGDQTTTVAVSPAGPADAYHAGIVQAVGEPQGAMSQPSGARSNRDSARSHSKTPSANATRSATLGGLSCTNNADSDLHGLSVEPSLTPDVAAIWKHPVFGGGGIYLGAGGLSLFQASLTGTITVNFGVAVSGAATCSLGLPKVKTAVPAGPLGAVLLTADPSLKFTVAGKVDLRASVTLTCTALYRWNKGDQSRVSYCKTSHKPMQLSADSGVDATLTGSIGVAVTLNDLVGIKGKLTATVHAGYHPAAHPVAQLDATVAYDLTGCLACFWGESPVEVDIARGTIFGPTILAVYDTAPPKPESGGSDESEGGGSGGGGDVHAIGSRIAAGHAHSCAIVAGGSVRCWGDNQYGQLGNGTFSRGPSVATVSDLNGVVAIAAGHFHTCAIVDSGSVKCWGYNGHGQLGNGGSVSSSTPVEVISLRGAIAITAGWIHTCALLNGGSVRCWGNGEQGRLGNGILVEDEGYDSTVPVAVSDVSHASAIVAGELHTCAIVTAGAVRCWGWNGDGQLGDGSFTDRARPITVNGLSGATALSAGWGHTCAIIAGGVGRCWGGGSSGELGNGSNESHPTPVVVSNLSGAEFIASGGHHTCAVVARGDARCWGNNNTGQLGNGTFIRSSVPVKASDLTGAIGITAGTNHTCAVDTNVAIRCWGRNDAGQLGNGTTESSSTPRLVTTL